MNVPLTPVRCLRYARQQFPAKVAVICGNQRFTYEQFGERAQRLAGALRSLGVSEGDRVAFLSANCHRLLEAYYGVAEAGAVLLPLNIRLNQEELAFILRDSEARILFLESQFLSVIRPVCPKLPSIQAYISLDGRQKDKWLAEASYEELLAASQLLERDLVEFDEDSVAELFYTSGTSAEPKGVMLTHRNIYLHGLSVAITHQPTQQTVELHTIPLFHANGWGEVHSVTYVGGTHVILERFDPVRVLELIEREGVTCANLVPAMATALVHCPQSRKYDLSSLRNIVIGGAASSPTLVAEIERRFGCQCYSSYGLTETSPVLTTSPVKPGIEPAEGRQWVQAKTGFAIQGVEIRVLDSEGKDVPRDGAAMGEIVVRGDGVMKGYWRQKEATEAALQDGWLHTGDLATLDPDNYLLIVDRKKDIIVSGGENISSLEVEKALLAHPSVYEAAVIPVPDPRWSEVPKAFVVLKPGTTATEAELVQFCRSRLAHYKCPKSVEFLESLPRTGTGKLLKRELRKNL